MEIYELSMSKNYVSDWDVADAVREILQNAIDSETNGFKKTIDYDRDSKTLSITNYGAQLDKSTLILGNGDKTGDTTMIGGFGEGYKLALLVLLRNGIQVSITNGKYIWTPIFEWSDKFNTEILKIVEKEGTQPENLTFYITGFDEDFINEELKPRFPCIDNDYGDIVKTITGDILLDKKFKGKMFVNGLFIQEDDDFAHGYNFLTSAVRLDRDRKAINYYDLRSLTARSLITAETCNPQIFKSICDSVTDADDIIDVIDEADETFLAEYKDMYFDKHDLEEGTFVGTGEVAKLIEGQGYKTHKGSEIESYIIAKAQNNLDLLEENRRLLDSMDNEMRGWKNLLNSNFQHLLKWFADCTPRLKVGQVKDFKEKFINKHHNFYTSYFNYIRDDLIENFPESVEDDYIENKIEYLINQIKE